MENFHSERHILFLCVYSQHMMTPLIYHGMTTCNRGRRSFRHEGGALAGAACCIMGVRAEKGAACQSSFSCQHNLLKGAESLTLLQSQ